MSFRRSRARSIASLSRVCRSRNEYILRPESSEGSGGTLKLRSTLDCGGVVRDVSVCAVW
eukprot:2297714-Rhodomonas_salina.1